MRRAALAAVLVSAAAVTGACSESDFGDSAIATTTAQHAEPIPESRQFDTPFPIAGENWNATVTLSALRIVPSSAYTDTVFAVDVRVVQSAGEPEIAPTDLTAYDPSGREFERIESPAGIVNDPLVPSVLTSPGQEIKGMVAWTKPEGARIGRIEVASPRTVGSITVTVQPTDPDSTPAGSAAGASGTTASQMAGASTAS